MISREDFICSICLGLLIDPLKLQCNHVFCQPCLKDLIKYNCYCFKCPMCRAEYPSGQQLIVDEAIRKIILENYPDEYKKRKHLVDNGFSLLPNQIEIKVIYGNLHKLYVKEDDESSDDDDKNNHEWTIYTKFEYNNQDDKEALNNLKLNSLIQFVYYKLDETFVPDAVMVKEPPYKLKRWGWDVFTIPITIKFKKEYKIEPIILEHHLVFEGNGIEKCQLVKIDISNLKEYKDYKSNLQKLKNKKK